MSIKKQIPIAGCATPGAGGLTGAVHYRDFFARHSMARPGTTGRGEATQGKVPFNLTKE